MRTPNWPWRMTRMPRARNVPSRKRSTWSPACWSMITSWSMQSSPASPAVIVVVPRQMSRETVCWSVSPGADPAAVRPGGCSSHWTFSSCGGEVLEGNGSGIVCSNENRVLLQKWPFLFAEMASQIKVNHERSGNPSPLAFPDVPVCHPAGLGSGCHHESPAIVDRDPALACQLNGMGRKGLLGAGNVLQLERPDLFHVPPQLATFSWLKRL